MKSWVFRRPYEYFDNREELNILKFSQEIGRYSEKDRKQAYEEISNTLSSYAKGLELKGLKFFVYTVLDDLYKFINMTQFYSESVEEYLWHSARVLFKEFNNRGLNIHYATNNTFSDDLRPTKIFPNYFKSAGITFISPYVYKQAAIVTGDFTEQEKQMFSEDSSFRRECLDGFLREIRNRDYVYLHSDGVQEDFKVVFQDVGNSNIVTVFREDVPVPHSKTFVWMD